jgi:hypothetical protein
VLLVDWWNRFACSTLQDDTVEPLRWLSIVETNQRSLSEVEGNAIAISKPAF